MIWEIDILQTSADPSFQIPTECKQSQTVPWTRGTKTMGSRRLSATEDFGFASCENFARRRFKEGLGTKAVLVTSFALLRVAELGCSQCQVSHHIKCA